MDAVLDLALVLGGAGARGADDKPVVQSQTAVGFGEDGVRDQGVFHRGLEVVRHHALGYAAKTLEGAAV